MPTDSIDHADAAALIEAGRACLGIELGSTRIKAALIGPDHRILATGAHAWENSYVDGIWTYPLESVWEGVAACVADLTREVADRYAVTVRRIAGLGISAMMHGYLAFDEDGELLTPFRTWRNSGTGQATEKLSASFGVNIPHRWSVAHFYQAMLDGEEHVSRVASLTTLSGYVHHRLTGERVLGIGDASGMFPIDASTHDYDATMLAHFDELAREHGIDRPLADLLPTVKVAGRAAGSLTPEGARLLDPTGTLEAGAPLCPPEGDAGTGMVATGSIAPRTGNVSAGTSVFAMVVLERPLARSHPELDLVTTPAGDPVAMVHTNNGTSELDAWARVFTEFAAALGATPDAAEVFGTLYRAALQGDPDAGGLTTFNYLAGEPITHMSQGRPLVLRTPDSSLTLANLMRAHLFSVFGTLRIGMDVLQDDEGVEIDRLFAHGGMFTTPGVAQSLLAAAVDTPVTVGAAAAQGGPWGIALLAQFAAQHGEDRGDLRTFLDGVFADTDLDTRDPDPRDVEGYEEFHRRYVAALPVQRAAVDHT